MLGAVAEADQLDRMKRVLASLLAAERGEQKRKLDVLVGREHGNQIESLEHEPDALGAPGRELAVREVREILTGHGHVSGVRVIEGAGHLPTLEQPGATTQAMRDWLEVA